MDKFMQVSAHQADFMTIAFFASRFGVKESCLEWGIKKIVIDDNEYCSPVLKIHESQSHIDIMQDKILNSPDVFGRHVELLPAQMQEEKDTYVFSAETKCVVVNKEKMKKLYEGKFLTPDVL